MENTMLIIDDSEMNRDILKMIFADKFMIMEAENGIEGMAVLDTFGNNIDIILLDIFMPELDGFGFLEERKNHKYAMDIPVVIITSSGETEDQISAFQKGANDYICKPFIPEIVKSRVENVMASRQRLISVELEAAKLKTKAEIDQMTLLYNKSTSERIIDDILQYDFKKLHALILIDIDNFKSVNDIAGHQAGDHTIKIVANLISGHFRKTDIVGRVGGDEFVALMQDVSSVDVVRAKVNELVQIMKYKPNLTIPENVSLSIGFVDNARLPGSYKELFAKADEALYIAKANGKARFQQYGDITIDLQNDTRPAVILLSRCRNITSVINAIMPGEVRIIEVLDMEDLSNLSTFEIMNSALIYADATDADWDSKDFWEKLKAIPGVNMDRVIAICQEGALKDYKFAMDANVADILAAPVDKDAFKRRTKLHLTRVGVLKSEE